MSTLGTILIHLRQYVMGLAIITVAFESLYVLWVFMDCKSFTRYFEGTGDEQAAER